VGHRLWCEPMPWQRQPSAGARPRQLGLGLDPLDLKITLVADTQTRASSIFRLTLRARRPPPAGIVLEV
jgi:hypothetical protein